MSAHDLDAAFASATRAAAVPDLSPVGAAAMERAAKDVFLAALHAYRHAVGQARHDGSVAAHELLHSAYGACCRREPERASS
jgi:hypothetical protein